MQFNQETYTFTDPGRFGRIMLILGIAGLAVSAIGLATDMHQFFNSYMTNFTFWASLGFGALFFVMVHHLTGAVWSVVVRRLAAAAMATLPMVLLLSIPVLLGVKHIFVWGDHDFMMSNPMLTSKIGYLNPPFFIVRTLVYILVWVVLGRLLIRTSLQMDQGWAPNALSKFQRISGPGMVLYAFTVSFAAFDWCMSLQPQWYSTIYGVWFFAGGLVMIMAFLAVAVNALSRKGVLASEISVEHRHDIAKLMFAFMIFWAYMHLSQYLLIWYADLPEEVAFFRDRWIGSWKVISVLIPLTGFVIPFVLMMSRHVKRNRVLLTFWSLWLIAMHWIDLYWNITPTFHPDHAIFSWMDVTLFIGQGGLMLWLFWRHFTSHPVLPLTDPHLQDSLDFVNQ